MYPTCIATGVDKYDNGETNGVYKSRICLT